MYNNYLDVLNAVKSIENYTSHTIKKKIYLVDNTENFHEDFNRLQKEIIKYSDIEYIKSNKNLGFGKAHNLILDKIDSKYHAIINPDIELKEDSFTKIISFLNKNKNIGMCIPKLVDKDGKLQYVYRKEVTIFDIFVRRFCKNIFKKRYEEHSMQNQDYSKMFDVPFGQGSFLVIRTELFKKLNGFDERYFMYMEDVDLCKRLNEISRLVYFPETYVVHKWEKGSEKNIKLFLVHFISMCKYFNKWGIKWI